MAPLTLARTALLGAGQAVWVLSGPRAIRLRRTALVHLDETNLEIKYLQGYEDSTLSAEAQSARAQRLKLLADRLEDLKARLTDAKGKKGRPFTSTDMLRDVAQTVAGPRPQDWLEEAFHHQWSYGSSVAHSRMWGINLRQDKAADSRAVGTVTMRFTISDQEYASALGAATLTMARALGLWDLRRGRLVAEVKRDTTSRWCEWPAYFRPSRGVYVDGGFRICSEC